MLLSCAYRPRIHARRHSARAAAWLGWLPGLPTEPKDDAAAAGAGAEQQANGTTAPSGAGSPAAVAGRVPPGLAPAEGADGESGGSGGQAEAEAEADGGLPLPQRLRDDADALADVVQVWLTRVRAWLRDRDRARNSLR